MTVVGGNIPGQGGVQIPTRRGYMGEDRQISDPTRKRQRSALVDLFPPFAIAGGWFTEIEVPAATTFSNSAWYMLRRIKVDEDTGQEISLYGVHATLYPADVDGGANPSAGTAGAWGDARGITAAVVVGFNLPIASSGWSDAVCELPGIEASGLGLIPSGSRLSPYPFAECLPPGKFTDTAPQKHVTIKSFAPRELRIPSGKTLDIALVTRGSVIQGIAGAGVRILGYAHVQCSVGLTRETQGYTEG